MNLRSMLAPSSARCITIALLMAAAVTARGATTPIDDSGTVVLTPTVSLPPQMGLDVKVDPALSRTIAANEPWTPAPATGSFRDRLQTQVPTTPFLTAAPNR